MLSTAEPETASWPVLPVADDWFEDDSPAGTERASKYYRARYYDPKIGRFISEDPNGGTGLPRLARSRDGVNLYAYAANEPVGRIDPDGRASIAAPILLGGAAAWTIHCAQKAYADGEARFPSPTQDSIRHCYVTCTFNRCMGLLAPVHTVAGAVGFEALSSFSADASADIVSGAAGVGLSYIPLSCDRLCQGCPLPGNNN